MSESYLAEYLTAFNEDKLQTIYSYNINNSRPLLNLLRPFTQDANGFVDFTITVPEGQYFLMGMIVSFHEIAVVWEHSPVKISRGKSSSGCGHSTELGLLINTNKFGAIRSKLLFHYYWTKLYERSVCYRYY